jgi:sec-independent protein translocase protein TatA
MGIGFRELLVILAIVILVFGVKKLKQLGPDLGAAIRGFKKSMNEGDADESVKQLKADAEFAEPAKVETAEKTERKV